MRDRVADTEYRAQEIRANRLFSVGTIAAGGEAHLIQTPSGILHSSLLGGIVAIGDTILMRRDGGQSFFS
jgi:hypothetical protein